MKATSLLAVFSLLVSAGTQADESLSFLGQANAEHVWVIDSAFDPTPLVGLLNPPYEVGENQLTRIKLASNEVAQLVPLGDGGAVLSFELSPDGDSALVAQINRNALLWVTGLREPSGTKIVEVPLVLQPLSLAYTADGRRAAVGYQTNGTAMVSLIDGLGLDSITVHPPISLQVSATVLAAVEAIEFSPDGKRLVTHAGLHDAPPPEPQYFIPRTATQSNVVNGSSLTAGAPFFAGQQSALPPSPPFENLATGVALGDFVITCDGERLLLPVSGALDLGQPDARILILGGVRNTSLELIDTLSLPQEVDIAPFQVELAPDCNRATVTNSFAGTVSVLSGIQEGTIHIANRPLTMPFPAEPAITPDGSTLVVQHTRPPIDGVPPTSVTTYDLESGAPLGAPIYGPVRSWIQVKDRTLAAWPAGLADHVDSFGWPAWASKPLKRKLRKLAGEDLSPQRRLKKLASVSYHASWYAYLTVATSEQYRLVQSYVDLAVATILRSGALKDNRSLTSAPR